MLVAALLMDTALGEVEHNLFAAKRLVTAAAKQGAELIVLPEFFNSCMGFSPKMLSVARWDEHTLTAMTEWSQELNVVVCGSFLSFCGSDVTNRFAMVFPDGQTFFHCKDIPTQFENCYYINGDENNILHTPLGDIGVALCWEMLRYDTARRLVNNVDFIVAGSCWWDLPEDAPPDSDQLRNYNQTLARDTPCAFANLIGVPLIHAAHCSKTVSYRFPDASHVQCRQMVGAAQICDADGNAAARRSFTEGEGLVLHNISPRKNRRVTIHEDKYWIADLPEVYTKAWERNNALGRIYYQTVAGPCYHKQRAKESAT